MEKEIEKLRNELSNARKEISNLRSKINSLQHIHRKDIESIRSLLLNKCEECQNPPKVMTKVIKSDNSYNLKPIGYVKTAFTQKRGIPRQAVVGDSILSRIEIAKDAFSSNAEQSVEGLNDFSHIWIFYIFHKNEPYLKPKVYPPRLNGKSIGVLSTRSPHRPNAIGMSLVKLDKVDGRTIYFYGTDMLDKTPVIDIKPYIPHYDHVPTMENEEVIKVPDWIRVAKVFKVNFSENSLSQIKKFKINLMSLEEVLKHDPRSVYVRGKYLSQSYSFQFDDKSVTCEFDDEENCVEVLEIK